MISPRRKPGRYGLSGRGCLPGHLARAQAGGNSSNSLSKDFDLFRRNWQGPCWVAVVVVDAEVWELKLPRSIIGLRGRAAPPDALRLQLARTRTRFRRAMPPCTGVRHKLRCERLSFGVGLCPPALLRLFRVQRAPVKWLRGGIVGARRLLTEALLLTSWSSESRRPRQPRCYG